MNVRLAAEVPRDQVQRAAAVPTPLRAAGDPREKRDEGSEPDRSDKKCERALGRHGTTVLLASDVAARVRDADFPDRVGPRRLEARRGP